MCERLFSPHREFRNNCIQPRAHATAVPNTCLNGLELELESTMAGTNTKRTTTAVPKNKIKKTTPVSQKPESVQVNSVADFLSSLENIKYVTNKLWYRGTGNSDHQLIPSLFRHKTAKTQSDLKALELDLNDTFEMRSLPYAESRNWAKDEWERLFFMQHFRVPTRLLDWSGSPLISLHFAVNSVALDKLGNAVTDVAVWVLDPAKWNDAAYADTGFPGGVLSAKDIWLKRYSPSEVYTSNGSLPPVAMRGVHNSARIVAQQGFFTVFGPQAEPMEKTFGWKKDNVNAFPRDCLRKFVIPKSKVVTVREEVFSLGIAESTIYPDLEGLAAELKRIFGFQ
ncbi:hypothetical protein CFBP6762_04032 [Xanthomonas arboricola pv. fragariae]|nr:hypothetical protein CFBP6762_04032 [Xanthomonas arboricola pv. fragariae]